MSTWLYRDPVFGELLLDQINNLFVAGYDLGFPQARRVSYDIANASGEQDITQFHSGRVLSLSVRTTGSPAERQTAAMQLRRFMHPARRVDVQWTSEAFGTVLFQACAADRFSGQVPIAQQALVTSHLWRVPSGVMVAAVEQVASILAATGTITGRTYDLTFDRSYGGTGAAPGSGIVMVGGTTYATPILRAYGPAVNPTVQIIGTGGNWTFTQNGGLSIAAGDWVEINIANRTAYYNGAPGSSVFDKLDFSSLNWAALQPGNNEVRYTAVSGVTGTTQLTVTWRDTYI